MPLIYVSNYARRHRHETPDETARSIVSAIRKVCLNVDELVPGLQKIDAAELAINAAGENFFPEDGSPIHVYLTVLYQRPERTSERLQQLGNLIADAVQTVCPLQAVKVTLPPLLDTKANVIVSRRAHAPHYDPREGRLL